MIADRPAALGQDEIRALIAAEDAWAVRALVRLYDEQTPAEKFTMQDMGVRNGRGFSPFDTGPLSALAEKYEETGRLTRPDVDYLKGILPKYAGQIVRLMARDEMARLQERIDREIKALAAARTKRAARGHNERLTGLLEEMEAARQRATRR